MGAYFITFCKTLYSYKWLSSWFFSPAAEEFGKRTSSPLLFCLAELSRGLTKLHTRVLVQTISSPRDCTPPSQYLYAYGVFIFIRGDARSLNNLMCFLECYSRFFINKDRIFLFHSAHAIQRKDFIQSIWGFQAGSFPFNYLGVPIFKGHLKRIYF